MKLLTPQQALLKIQRYCAYQDRCHQEVRSKLLEWQVYGDTLEEIMALLIEENFLNEERFARSYARGKFRIKQWGRVRIEQELKRRKISPYCIRKALEEIDAEEYESTLKILLEKKAQQLDLYSPVEKQKLGQYAIQKGYESNLVWMLISSLTTQ